MQPLAPNIFLYIVLNVVYSSRMIFFFKSRKYIESFSLGLEEILKPIRIFILSVVGILVGLSAFLQIYIPFIETNI